jgi:replicative DNA helicase
MSLPIAEHELFFCLVLDNDMVRHVDLRPDQFSRQGENLYRLIRDSIDAGGLGVAELVEHYERGRISADLVEDLARGPEHQPVPTPSVVSSACRAIRERWVEDQTARAIRETAELGPSARVSAMLDRLRKIQQGALAVSTQRLADLAVEAYARLDAEEQASPPACVTPWRELNDLLDGGFRSGEYVLVGARPSMGKSTFVRLLAQHCVGPVLFATAEDTAEMVTLRALSSQSGVPLSAYRSMRLRDEEYMATAKGVASLRESEVEILSGDALTVEQIAAQAAMQDYRLIVVDYLQMIVRRGKDQTEDAGRVSLELKRLARRAGCPVVVASQLNRELERRPNKRPINADLRQTGDLEQDADTILFLYRDEVYDEASRDAGILEVIVSKQRNGPAGSGCYVKMRCDLARGRIG